MDVPIAFRAIVFALAAFPALGLPALAPPAVAASSCGKDGLPAARPGRESPRPCPWRPHARRYPAPRTDWRDPPDRPDRRPEIEPGPVAAPQAPVAVPGKPVLVPRDPALAPPQEPEVVPAEPGVPVLRAPRAEPEQAPAEIPPEDPPVVPATPAPPAADLARPASRPVQARDRMAHPDFIRSLMYAGVAGLALSLAGLAIVGWRRRQW